MLSETDQSVALLPASRVLVIGAGLIGTSIALALTAGGHQVHLRDRTSSHGLVAASLGAGTVDEPDEVDLVVVAVPPAATAAVVVQALEQFLDATVTDVASVKAPILADVRDCGADQRRYVGSHPMAGSHRSGPLTARADLFVDRTWVVAAGPQADPASVAQVEAVARLCGSRVEIMDPVEHDLAVAEVSHVPQIVSSLMAANLVDVDPAHLQLAGQGVRDVTRVAASDPGMWTQIIMANRSAIRSRLVRLRGQLDEVVDHLDRPAAVTGLMTQGVHGTKLLPGKHGRTPLDYVDVVVEIPDSPGALARLFADVGRAGVNVEDLSIDHDVRREVGYISIAVEQTKAAALGQAMVDAGWSLRL
ncbi:MAG: prephenate dehydrogenase [Propionibacteriaceae bacterium]|jgi:prephenate dehydrogenase|nr:prephenate dehydrogenase [Propionibacteriaceae bacterium]